MESEASAVKPGIFIVHSLFISLQIHQTSQSLWNALQVPPSAARLIPKFVTTKQKPRTRSPGRQNQLWVHYFALRHPNCDYRVVISRRVDRCFSGKSWHIHFRPPIKFSDSMVRVSTMTLYFSPLILPRVRCPLYLSASYARFEMRSPFSMVRGKHPLIRLHRVEKSISPGL